MADAVDVDTAARHIGGHQHGDAPFAEALQGLDPLVLRHVARQLGGVDAVAHQALLDAPHFVLAVGKDHHPFPLVLGHQVVQQLVLVTAGHGIDVLLDGFAGDILRFDLDDCRVRGPLLGQVHHVFGEGSREQQGLALALGWGLADDLPNLGDEAHVEHAVGFVQDQHFDHVQVRFAALVEVQQTARGGHQDVAVAGFEGLELLVEVHATDEGHDVQAGVFGQRRGVLGDLYDQFAGRGNDQRPRLAHVALFWRRGLLQLGNDRNQEGCGLAGAGLGPADGVFATQGVTQDLGLDRRAIREAEVVDRMHQLGRELEVMEAGLAFLRLDGEVFQLPGGGCGFWLALTARLGLSRFFGANRGRGLGLERCRRGRGLGCCGRLLHGGSGFGGELLNLALAEHLLECFEHGHLINWLRNVRRAV